MAFAADVPVTCAMRVEGTIIRPGAVATPAPTPHPTAQDAIRGPFWIGGGRVAFAWNGGEGFKLPVFLKAGHRATVAVAPAHRKWATLRYGRDGARAAFVACPPGTPRRDGKGTVAVTMWAGVVKVNAPHCIRLRVTVDGRRRQDIRLALGRACD